MRSRTRARRYILGAAPGQKITARTGFTFIGDAVRVGVATDARTDVAFVGDPVRIAVSSADPKNVRSAGQAFRSVAWCPKHGSPCVQGSRISKQDTGRSVEGKKLRNLSP